MPIYAIVIKIGLKGTIIIQALYNNICIAKFLKSNLNKGTRYIKNKLVQEKPTLQVLILLSLFFKVI
jgi:hypothetical protein